jgi:hypothetical protein
MEDPPRVEIVRVRVGDDGRVGMGCSGISHERGDESGPEPFTHESRLTSRIVQTDISSAGTCACEMPGAPAHWLASCFDYEHFPRFGASNRASQVFDLVLDRRSSQAPARDGRLSEPALHELEAGDSHGEQSEHDSSLPGRGGRRRRWLGEFTARRGAARDATVAFFPCCLLPEHNTRRSRVHRFWFAPTGTLGRRRSPRALSAGLARSAGRRGSRSRKTRAVDSGND